MFRSRIIWLLFSKATIEHLILIYLELSLGEIYPVGLNVLKNLVGWHYHC